MNKLTHNSNLVKFSFLIFLLYSINAFSVEPKAESTKPQKQAVEVARDCDMQMRDLAFQNFQVLELEESTGQVSKASGTDVPIVRAFEKEGRYYSEIAQWFPHVKPEVTNKLVVRLQNEQNGTASKALTKWLKDWSVKYRIKGNPMTPKKWEALTFEEKLSFLLTSENFFDLINTQGREDIFEMGILTFDDVPAVEGVTPTNLVVGDDLGSYEVRTKNGIKERDEFLKQRDIVEEGLDGPIGHQHFFHAWPKDAAVRAEMAPRYIELLDGTTWYLFWRQAKRNPDEVDTILEHPYLGVYDRNMLDRLNRAVLANDAKKFNNKFRMVGARGFKASKDIPEQGEGYVPDWELRSGNKGVKREFIELMVEARLTSGDYSNLRKFTDYLFDASAPMDQLTMPFLEKSDIEILLKFEKSFAPLKYSDHAESHNHLRNKYISPLLPWKQRLDLEYKANILDKAQKEYAEELVKVAKKYLKDGIKNGQKTADELEARETANEEIAALVYQFADKVRLDKDFELYLNPFPTKEQLPPITVKNDGPVDVNGIDLGLEYSFRFPAGVKITSKKIAEQQIRLMLENLQSVFGEGTIVRTDSAGHGHNASVKFTYTDPKGRTWRAEWDGVQRSYIDGVLTRPHGGHNEVPTPKMAPEDFELFWGIFSASRLSGQVPSRAAGGGHVNVDLGPLVELGDTVGPQKLLNLISYYESIREMVTFIWQSPIRQHAALPVEMTPELTKAINSFEGNWNDLGKMLYDNVYFNPFISRKPRYVELNVTSVMNPILPDAYKKGTLDIKNPEMEWFPDFGNTVGRIEFRLFDAPTDPFMAALQIQYVRALLNKAFNAPGKVLLQKRFDSSTKKYWAEHPEEFVKAAQQHFDELGLPWDYFKYLVPSAVEQQQTQEARPRELVRYPKFLPSLPAEQKKSEQ